MARILVVDDEPLICKALRRILEGAGHEVITASDGGEAWSHLEEESFDMILTDLFMPGTDGIELLTRLTESEERPVVVAMSGGGRVVRNTDALVDAAALGADHVLEKPFTPDMVIATVTTALRKS
ncbi:MAG: response regulator [Longimicrobiales bacterium]|nr:response regulator [Longimicrobiales bacterium]